jgi:histone acetyltransferase SAS3
VALLAVKIQPRDLEDDEEASSRTDSESAASGDDDESKDSTDAEVGVEWDPTADEEEDEPANPNRCMYVSFALSQMRLSLTKIPRFCQQDEENDPSEEFELYLACGVCGDNGLLISSVLLTRLTRL